ncbi:transporter [Sapientia aquatica]|uniref:transporter n=1 Tax=Sapientia aquatica TaxID=1549640 RepID=UPI001D0DA8CE|nr:transporter [Sapientia aquatica]
MARRHIVPILCTSLFFSLAHAEADDGIVPYRPTVSNPAQLSPAGQLEFEFGGLSAKTGDVSRGSLPYLLKLAFNENWGVLLGGEAWVRNANNGAVDRGFGDTTATLKRAFLLSESTALGLEFNVKAPTANTAIGSGKVDYGINGIVSHDFGQIEIDLNLNATHLGGTDAVEGAVQTGWAGSLAYTVSDKWEVDLELSGTKRRLVPNTAQFLAAISYSPSNRMTVDIGIVKGLNSSSPDWAIFTGIVVPVTKFW